MKRYSYPHMQGILNCALEVWLRRCPSITTHVRWFALEHLKWRLSTSDTRSVTRPVTVDSDWSLHSLALNVAKAIDMRVKSVTYSSRTDKTVVKTMKEKARDCDEVSFGVVSWQLSAWYNRIPVTSPDHRCVSHLHTCPKHISIAHVFMNKTIFFWSSCIQNNK